MTARIKWCYNEFAKNKEGAKIDKKSHNGSGRNIMNMMKEVVDFSNAVEAVEERISGKYALIVTADHETGGLKKAENKSQLTNSLYTASDLRMLTCLCILRRL